MVASLQDVPLSGNDISRAVGIPEKEVYGHLRHIQRSLHFGDLELVTEPARCLECGFVFKKRERLKRPGKCPLCRSEEIQEPLFSVARRDRRGR